MNDLRDRIAVAASILAFGALMAVVAYAYWSPA